jgi:hypothetical protein
MSEWMKLRDTFEVNGLRHDRLPQRPDCDLRGHNKMQIGPIAFDVFADWQTATVYARAYVSETGEVAWYRVTKLEAPPVP